MSFAPTREHRQMQETLRSFLATRSSELAVRRLIEADAGFDVAVWQDMATSLGLHGIAVPQSYGGLGLSTVELGLALEEMGRALLCAPFLSTVAFAVPLLLRSPDEPLKRFWLDKIVTGGAVATVAGSFDELPRGEPPCRATQEGDGWKLHGRHRFVLDGALADVVIVVAATEAGVGLFLVEAGSEGLITTALETLDLTRTQSHLHFDNVAALPLAPTDVAADIARVGLFHARIALAAEQVGLAQAALDMSVSHARHRIQFGRPIGSFQAIKHKCADMLIEVETARSAVYHALQAAALEADDLPMLSGLAKARASEAAFRVTATNIQIHGGMGFTWDHPAHLYFRRAKSTQALLGSPDQLWDQVGDELTMTQ